ncbi:MAG: efflux RND transporter periplasmic adaptor subunit [Bacteroidota bacterium]|nr:efflux RND transporter periplasmic adaptor subunit [Odoribacter sp.]MDP3643303.1 efflux RND transporter periplasmic adaptor subunit [Bacteroidota bacterium]
MKKKSNKKLLPYGIALVAVIIIVLVSGKKLGWFGKDYQINVSTKVVESKTITEQITANGKVQPETEVKISPDVSGEIIELQIEEGDEVKKGELLMVIKPDMYVQAYNRAQASLSSSQARLAQADARLIESDMSFKRASSLFKQDAIPVSDYESAQASFKVAQSEVKAAQFAVKSSEASVAEAQEQLVKTKIYAPMDGTISRLNVEKGERVVGTNMYAGTETMVIANLHLMEVKVDVNENDIVRVNLNDTALVEVDAYLGRKFKGIVTEIANSANVVGGSTDQVTNFNVKILLLEDSYKDLVDTIGGKKYPFRPGMSATVDIQTETRKDVISVPIQAVTTRSLKNNLKDESKKEATDKPEEVTEAVTQQGAKSAEDEKVEVVFVYKDGKVFKQAVKTGIQDSENIEITEGLKTGDEIVVAPFNAINKQLNDSTLVKKVDEKELFKVKK